MALLLSAALIVRNEAHHIGFCLTSLNGIVDEIVVVDTGSTDDTRTIAADHGAIVHDTPWGDDFAAARNVAISHCTSDWILYIDADERVRPTSRDRLAEVLEDPALGCCYVQLIAKIGMLPYREMRLFRRHDTVRFEGVIHENIWPSLNRYLKATGRVIGSTELVLDHVGYEGAQNHKHARNIPLLEKALELDPTHSYCWYHLGVIRLEQGDVPAARNAFWRGIEASRERSPRPEQDSLVFVELAHLELETGSDARPIVEELLRLFPDNAHGLWLRAQLNLRDSRFDEAQADFHALLAWPQRADAAETSLGYDPRLFGSLAADGLATCCWQRKDYAGAAEWYERADRAETANLEFRVKAHYARSLAKTGKRELAR